MKMRLTTGYSRTSATRPKLRFTEHQQMEDIDQHRGELPNHALQPTPVGALSCISRLSPGVAELWSLGAVARSMKIIVFALLSFALIGCSVEPSIETSPQKYSTLI